MDNSFYSQNELTELKFKSVGRNVLISRFARFYGAEDMEIGNHVRIDDFCILSGIIKLGNYIHISAYSALYGKYGIEMYDYSGLSPRCTVFSATDDFSGNYMIGPMLNTRYTNVTGSKITIGKFTQVGCNCVILPGVTIGEGVAIGAMSLINSSLDSWKVYAGIPAKFLKERSKGLLSFIRDEK
jgi:galactoside O-acetyltransferase